MLLIIGMQALKSHTNGQKHREWYKPISIFFKKPGIKSKQKNPGVVNNRSKDTSFSNQLTLDQSLVIGILTSLWNC